MYCYGFSVCSSFELTFLCIVVPAEVLVEELYAMQYDPDTVRVCNPDGFPWNLGGFQNGTGNGTSQITTELLPGSKEMSRKEVTLGVVIKIVVSAGHQ